jgi:hypothetical protein
MVLKTAVPIFGGRKGGHCPYGWSATNREYEEWDCASFFRDFGKKDEGALRAKYREGVQ